MKTTNQTRELFTKYANQFEKATPYGEPFIVSVSEAGTGDILYENAKFYAIVATIKTTRGMGHVIFTDPETEMQFKCFNANSTLKNAFLNATTHLILLKVTKKEGKDKDDNLTTFYSIRENTVTSEDCSDLLK